MDTVGTFEEDYYPRDPGLNIAMLTQWLFESHQPALAAKLLLPLLDKCDDDQQFLDNTAEQAAALYGYHMLNVLAGKRDYAAALDDAHTLQNFYPHTRFSDLADELALELPARDQDFITLTLPNLPDHRFARQFYDPTAGDSFAKSIIWDYDRQDPDLAKIREQLDTHPADAKHALQQWLREKAAALSAL